jgi:3D (Asp-Asp-Asp) domain-containing protein
MHPVTRERFRVFRCDHCIAEDREKLRIAKAHHRKGRPSHRQRVLPAILVPTWFAIAALIVSFPAPASSTEIEITRGIASVDNGRPTRFDGGRYGGRVATGARFRRNIAAVAHRTLPLGSMVCVEHRNRERTAVVNDRGPCATAHCQARAPRLLARILDLTPSLADALHCDGLCRISFRRGSCEG